MHRGTCAFCWFWKWRENLADGIIFLSVNVYENHSLKRRNGEKAYYETSDNQRYCQGGRGIHRLCIQGVKRDGWYQRGKPQPDITGMRTALLHAQRPGPESCEAQDSDHRHHHAGYHEPFLFRTHGEGLGCCPQKRVSGIIMQQLPGAEGREGLSEASGRAPGGGNPDISHWPQEHGEHG